MLIKGDPSLSELNKCRTILLRLIYSFRTLTKTLRRSVVNIMHIDGVVFVWHQKKPCTYNLWYTQCVLARWHGTLPKHFLVGNIDWRTPCHSKEMWLWIKSSEKVVYSRLTHSGRVTHICIRELTIIGSDNGLSPGRRQTIIRTNAGILLIGSLETNFSEILINIYTF